MLDKRIGDTYARHSTAANKRSLYDSYVRAIRWASDRIEDSGVIGFVTNAGWLESNAMDGLRKCLAQEFTSIYVLHLRGNARTQGDRRQAEGSPLFGAGSRAPVTITVLVRNPERQGCRILFHNIGEYLSREEKLEKVKAFGSLRGIEANGGWTELQPDAHHDWLNQRDPGFAAFMAMGDKSQDSHARERIFQNYSMGVQTNRDAWCYNYSEASLRDNIRGMIRFYNAERERLKKQITAVARGLSNAEVTRIVDNDPTKISWSRGLKNDLGRNKALDIDEGRIALSQYRPFTRQYLYFSRRLNGMIFQIPKLFPHVEVENRVICVTGRGESDDFSCLMVNAIPNLHLIAGGQCFPRWLYSKPSVGQCTIFGNGSETDSHGYVRESAISEAALAAFGEKLASPILSADDVFHYVYGVLHMPAYRSRYATNLKKEFPRIPIPQRTDDFAALVRAGEALASLHVDYEAVEPWPIEFDKGGWEPDQGIAEMDWFRVGNKPMRHPRQGKTKDRTRVLYNDHITVSGIPEKAYGYMVNGKPAIAWVMERQRVRTDDKASGIVNDANRYALETMQDPAYPLKLLSRVIRVSMETLRIVGNLPEPEWST